MSDEPQTEREKRIAEVSTSATAREAYLLAGHAVAAVHRGGVLTDVHLGRTDWSSRDESDDIPGQVEHHTDIVDRPFTTYAGVWAEAKWMVEDDPKVDDLEEALEAIWDEPAATAYEGYKRAAEVALSNVAKQMGFPLSTNLAFLWEHEWMDELEPLWPAVRRVAVLLIAGQSVTHETVFGILAELELLDGDAK